MNKAKFWLAQIAMIAIVGLVLGSPALAGGVKNGNASENGIANASKIAGGEGGENTRGHVGSHSSGGGNGGNGGSKPQSEDTSTGTSDPVCTSSNTSGCTADSCSGSWNASTSTCSFF